MTKKCDRCDNSTKLLIKVIRYYWGDTECEELWCARCVKFFTEDDV